MSKIVKENIEVLNDNDATEFDATEFGVVTDFLERKNIGYTLFEGLSNLVSTMTGDGATEFNTIGEMLECIPEIINCTEETCILCLYLDKPKYFVLDWDYENDTEGLNNILNYIENGLFVE